MNGTSTFKDLRDLKTRLIDAVLMAGTPIGLAAFALSLYPFESVILNYDFLISCTAVIILLGTFVFKKRIPVEYKAGVIILLLYLIFTSELFIEGIYSNDILFFMLIPFMSVLFYPYWATVSVYIFSIGTYLLAGYLTTIGLIEVPYDYTEVLFINWLENALVVTVVIFVITLFLYQFEKKIYSLFLDLQIKNDDLTEREHLLSTITDNFPRSYMSVIDSNYRIMMTGGGEFKNQGLDPKLFNGKRVKDVYSAYGDEITNTILDAYKETLNGKGQVFQIQLADQYQVYKTMPLPDKNGDIKSFLSVVENITETVEKENLIEENLNEKNVLLQEIHHRVKNNLAVVSGLLTLQSSTIEDQKSKFIFEKSTNRIMSIAKVHEMLYESKNFNRIPFNQYINELSQIILDSMNSDGKTIKFDTDIQVDYISINHGVPLGIIFNELITNSVKYGFNGSLNNTIKIEVSQVDERISVNYKDNGVGIEDFETAASKSLGFTLVESLLHQIDAEFEYNTKNKFELSFSFSADSFEAIPSN